MYTMCYQVASSEISSQKLLPALHLRYKAASFEATVPRSYFPHYICTTGSLILRPQLPLQVSKTSVS